MLFHTAIFFVFFVIFYLVYLGLRKTGFMNLWLLIASYIFYGWWSPLYLILIVVSTTIDYLAVILMERSRWKKPWLIVSLLSNLGLLGFFKYAGFVTENINLLFTHSGIPYAIPAPDILLPVGISFFTFQSMSYTIDAYRGNLKTEHDFVRFASFVSLFPQLVAGPIERASNLLPQLATPPKITKQDWWDGMSLFLVGFFKKVALADYLSSYVDPVYESPAGYGASALILATFAFGWQIYFDFSGYTDMARGVARVMGIRLMLNFNNPYIASSLGDFWNRWHISLSTWFRDYVYIPLGGNRGGKARTYFNMFVTMVISGFWHGANWGFLIWGALHAIGRMATRELEGTRTYREKVPTFIKQLFVFAFVTFAWIFFRAQTWETSRVVISRIFTTAWTDPQLPRLMAVLIAGVWAYQFIYSGGLRVKKVLDLQPVRIALAILMLTYIAIVAQPANSAFIYFQF